MSRCYRQGWAKSAAFAMLVLLLSSVSFAGIYPAPINVTVTGADAVAVGDFNGDGKMDLVVADGASSTVQVVLNQFLLNGAGSSASAISSPSAVSVPASLVVGDFNGDGKLDLALHNKYDSKIIVLLGNGDGSFQPPMATATTGSARLVTGDFNNDGYLDIATGNLVFLGKGDGTFRPAQTLSYAGTIYAAADLNGDSKLDLIGNDGIGFSILLGNGDGSFQAARSTLVHGTLRSLALADMNGDGHADIVAGVDTGSAGQVQVYLGNNDGSLQAALTQATSVTDPYEISVADFTADGHRDVVVAGGITQPVSLLTGSATGTLQTEILLPLGFAEGVAGASMAAGDFDANGVPDLVGSSDVGGRALIWLASSTGGFVTPSVYPYTGATVESADFNGDARPDAIFSDVATGKVGVMLDQQDHVLAAPVYTVLTSAPIAGMVPADLNADGILDLVFWTSSVTGGGTTVAGSTYAALGKGDGTFYAASVVSQSLSTQAVVMDLNADGYPDVADLDTAPGNVAVFLGKGDGTFGYEIGYPTGPGATYITAADVKQSGHPDLITAGASGVDLLPNNGDGTYAYYSAVSTTPALFVGAVDVDGDGKIDLVVTTGSGAATTATVYLGSGTGTFTEASQFVLGGATKLKFADVNHDGLVDIVADEGTATGVWLNTQAGTFVRAQDLPLGGALALADTNTDGLPDLLQLSSTRSFLTVAQNQFGTTAGGDFAISSPPAASVAAGDKTVLTLTLGSLNGYAGMVTLSCSGLPADTTCSFSPAKIMIPGTAVQATVIIQTSLDSISSLRGEPSPRRRAAGWANSGLVLCGLMMAGAGMRRKRIVLTRLIVTRIILLLAGVLSLLMLVSCSSPSAIPPIVSPAPKSATTTITISASAGAIVRSTQVALTITK